MNHDLERSRMVLNTREAAAVLEIHVEELRRLIRQGVFPCGVIYLDDLVNEPLRLPRVGSRRS